jgi:anti-sigma-K factor RskA
MSEAPDLPEAEALAAEHALGVLSGRERVEAEARMAREPAFAADVEAWRERLAPMAEAIEPVPAPEGLWPRIVRLLPANDNGALMNRLRFWRTSAMGGFALAAASLAAVVVQVANPSVVEKTTILPPQGHVMQASLMSQGERVQPLFVAAYDPDRKALIITSLLPEGTDPSHVHELWLIAGKEAPKPLGFIEPGKSKMIPMPTMHGKMAEGAALAVSIEPPGGSPDPNGPTGPIAAMGKLSKL